MNKNKLGVDEKNYLENLVNSRQKQTLGKNTSRTEILTSVDYYDLTNSNFITRVYYKVRDKLVKHISW